ncbi:MAG: universal stress protein [Bacteroidales bacterium]|nr:universal stress protein [Bacteroidales bacterium]
MKKIIVAIDFSKGSVHALKFAINIAKEVNADIQMIWVNKSVAIKPIYQNSKFDYLSIIREKFDELVTKYTKKLPNNKITYKIRKGKVYEEVVNQAKYNDAFLIVAGTHGVSGFEELWIGSNAYRIVSSAACPVITIRYGHCFNNPIQKILLPIDNTLETRQKVPFVSVLAKLMGAEIVILSLYPTDTDDDKLKVDKYTKQTKDYFDKAMVRYKTDKLLSENNRVKAIIDYTENKNIDLVAITTEHELSFSNLLMGQYAQQMVNHCPIPVLTINSLDLFDIATR